MATVQDAYTYAEQVLSGEIVACLFVSQACQRFVNDLETGNKRGLEFRPQAAEHALSFFQFSRHVKGVLSGESIKLEPWQVFIVANIFGWYWQETGLRRFRTAYNEVARKNAKSTLASCIALYMLAFDHEEGAEIYSCATKKDQARIVFNDARQMVLKSSELKRLISIQRNTLSVLSSYSKFEPLSSDTNTLDGLNVHLAVLDEVHQQKREMWDVIETSTGSRLQSLLFAITTAGFDKTGICYEQRGYAEKILSGVISDDTYFAIIFTLDECDDWKDRSVWIKANPNLNVSVRPDDLERLAKKAEEVPTARNNFLTKRLNIWVNTATAWLNLERWERCPPRASDEALQSLPCYVGIDLANKLDVAAVVLVFVDGDKLHLLCKFYLPSDVIAVKSRTIGNMYQSWADSGYLTLTEGNVIDHDRIEDDLREILDEYDVHEIAFDPWGSTQMANRLAADGAPLVEVPQNAKNLSEAMKEVEALVIAGKLHHGDNPVLNWMASNVCAKQLANENILPEKSSADNKIDGMVALFTAVSRIIRAQASAASTYEDNDLLIL